MDNATITFRTEKSLKEDATVLFNSLGMSLSSALNMFMRQAVLRQQYPCSLDLNITNGQKAAYPKGFFELFGSGSSLGLDEEPNDLPWEQDIERMPL